MKKKKRQLLLRVVFQRIPLITSSMAGIFMISSQKKVKGPLIIPFKAHH